MLRKLIFLYTKEKIMNKDNIINYLYYLLDKVHPAYYKEVKKSIYRIIKELDKYDIKRTKQ